MAEVASQGLILAVLPKRTLEIAQVAVRSLEKITLEGKGLHEFLAGGC